ncbi:ABC transporter ATP-binding protein, partial [Bosea sp. (in: a-proteobacteria)]|uniref:ABC transporter ATP-binding protein n=1 Tax=Bosea sp. (in: a-proteobacteria) TaxID=1871050 RepID=UPI002733DFAB
RLQVRETIVELQREAKITTVFVTHDREEALAMSDRIGVMNKGRLEQVGTPATIYREPATGYVADFVGGANLVEVETGRRQAGEVGPVAFDGMSLAARAPAALPAGRAILVARPEDIVMVEGEALDALPAAIAHRQYLGGKTSYKVALAGGRVLAVALQNGAHDRFEPGARVRLVLDPGKTLVLAS